MRLIIKNISNLVTCAGEGIKKGKEQRDAKIIENGYVIVNNDIIEELGSGEDFKKFIDKNTILIEGKGKTVTPGLVDPHTHVVYSGSRENELPLKLNKVSYIDILKAGGGILSTVENTRKTAEADLFNESKKRLDTMVPAAVDTIKNHFQDMARQPKDYDLIATGDLGKVGREMTETLLKKYGYDVKGIYIDCGEEIFDAETQKTCSGGSGCGCSAVVDSGYIYKNMMNGKFKRVLLVSTGALMSTISSFQGETIPGIAHAVEIEFGGA